MTQIIARYFFELLDHMLCDGYENYHRKTINSRWTRSLLTWKWRYPILHRPTCANTITNLSATHFLFITVGELVHKTCSSYIMQYKTRKNTVAKKTAHRQSLPRVLLSSALCKWGYWSASFLRAACAQTMKAFIGLLT